MKQKQVTVKVINNSGLDLPKYESKYAAGLDLRAFIPESITLKPMERKIIPTGLKIELPVGFEAQIRPRSGLAAKHGITVLNAPGTIDADYRGDVGVILINLSTEDFTINPGERIAQMVVASVCQLEWAPALFLSDTERGEGGFGRSGVK